MSHQKRVEFHPLLEPKHLQLFFTTILLLKVSNVPSRITQSITQLPYSRENLPPFSTLLLALFSLQKEKSNLVFISVASHPCSYNAC